MTKLAQLEADLMAEVARRQAAELECEKLRAEVRQVVEDHPDFCCAAALRAIAAGEG